jgi:hypothetical protein
MTRGPTTLFLALNALGVLLPAFGDEMSPRPVEVVHIAVPVEAEAPAGGRNR